MFLHRLGVVPVQLQCSCNSAAAPHLQLKKQLSHAQLALPQPNMQESHIYKHIYASLLVKSLSPCLHAAAQLQLRT